MSVHIGPALSLVVGSVSVLPKST